MKYFLIVFFLVAVSLTTQLACKSMQLPPENYENTKIYFGNGGGFTGKLKEYCLLDNGEVYGINPATRDATLRNVLKKSEVKALFKELDLLDFGQYPYDTPGNMFCWLKYHISQDTTYLIWSRHDTQVDDKIINVHKQLVATTKQQ